MEGEGLIGIKSRWKHYDEAKIRLLRLRHRVVYILGLKLNKLSGYIQSGLTATH